MVQANSRRILPGRSSVSEERCRHLDNKCPMCIVHRHRSISKILYVAIGATDVGTVEINEKRQQVGSKLRKGGEVGLFQFGGSSIIVAFEEGRFQFDEDLLSMSRRLVIMDVEVGMSLGRATSVGSY